MQIIHEELLNFPGDTIFLLPKGAKVLTVYAQPAGAWIELVLCVLVDPNSRANEERHFYVCGSERNLPEGNFTLNYITTVQHNTYALHVFEMKVEDQDAQN